MPYILDTDAVSIFLRGHAQIVERVGLVRPEDVWITAVTVEEMLSGRLAAINNARARAQVGTARSYTLLVDLVHALARFNIVVPTEEAERLYLSWPAQVRRVGKQDCRIAACAILSTFTLVTCNYKDYSRIPGVVFEDWSH